MAQWGAYGYAQQGYSYDEILAHYYKGTTIGQASVTKVRVFLAQGRSRLTVSSLAPFSVRDGIGQLWHLAAGPQTFGPGLRIKTTDVPQRQQLPGTAHVQRRLVAPQVRRPSVPRPGAGVRRERRPARGQRRRARGVPLRRRPVGDAARLAARGAQGAGGRGALVRARGQEERVVVRPLPGHAQPGLSRHRPRGAVDDRCGAGHRGPGRPVRRAAWRRRTSSRAPEAAPRPPPRSGRARAVLRISCPSTTRTTRSRPTTGGARSSFPRHGSGASSARADHDRRDDADRPVRPCPERDRGRLAGRVDDDRLGSPPRDEPSLDVVPRRHALARHPAGARHVRQERRAERRRAQVPVSAARPAAARDFVGAGPPDRAWPGRIGERLRQAARADRLPARQRRGPQRDRARLRRSARPLPRRCPTRRRCAASCGRSFPVGASRSSASTAPAGSRSRVRRSTRTETSRRT